MALIFLSADVVLTGQAIPVILPVHRTQAVPAAVPIPVIPVPIAAPVPTKMLYVPTSSKLIINKVSATILETTPKSIPNFSTPVTWASGGVPDIATSYHHRHLPYRDVSVTSTLHTLEHKSNILSNTIRRPEVEVYEQELHAVHRSITAFFENVKCQRLRGVKGDSIRTRTYTRSIPNIKYEDVIGLMRLLGDKGYTIQYNHTTKNIIVY